MLIVFALVGLFKAGIIHFPQGVSTAASSAIHHSGTHKPSHPKRISAGTGSCNAAVQGPYQSEKQYACNKLASKGQGDKYQYSCLVLLWNNESGWNPYSLNTQSGAYGIPQSLPADKMAAAGADWRTDPYTQIDWGLSYIWDTYGSPCRAWAFEISHVPNWY